jgi:hypothetical protein
MGRPGWDVLQQAGNVAIVKEQVQYQSSNGETNRSVFLLQACSCFHILTRHLNSDETDDF